MATLMALAALVVVLLPEAVLAQSQVERVHIQQTIENDPFLSEQCGTDVGVTVDIDITHQDFDSDPLRHRQQAHGTVTFSSEHGAVIQTFQHSGEHKIIEVLEELEPDVFLVRVTDEANGNLRLKSPDGRLLARDAGAVTFGDIGIWDRANDLLIGPLEREPTRVAGPHPLLDEDVFLGIVCGELTP